MHTISSKLIELEKVIYDKVEHPYIDKFLEKPFIDPDKLAMFYYLYDEVSITESKKKCYITTIMLVQMALDTHELIPSPSEKSMDETAKQLSVLAGDFYSGLYYYLLAEIDDISMVRTLANAIEKINEHKMVLYRADVTSLRELVTVMQEIEATLFKEVAQTIDIDQQTVDLVAQFFIVNRLYQELKKIRENRFSYMENYVTQHDVCNRERSLQQWIEEEIVARQQEIEQSLAKRYSTCKMLKGHLREKLSMDDNMMIAEEG
ncbi:MAG TPA: heptaprenyl diphosphate synthase component 1 [Pseudogracilibacillus sp.]|nr:heptaprenyl diphosphate synthase component 1 [Pseudogracilibacillus sp.]